MSVALVLGESLWGSAELWAFVASKLLDGLFGALAALAIMFRRPLSGGRLFPYLAHLSPREEFAGWPALSKQCL
jgi:hypothetical protein